MEKNIEKAFDFAAESTKQLIALATAIIALTVTFAKDIVGTVTTGSKTWLVWTWIFFIISVLLGIFTMLALTGTLDPMKNQANSPENQTINAKNVRILSLFQIFFFVIGIIFTCIFGFSSLNDKSVKPKEEGHKILRQTWYGGDSTVYRDSVLLPFK